MQIFKFVGNIQIHVKYDSPLWFLTYPQITSKSLRAIPVRPINACRIKRRRDAQYNIYPVSP